MSEGVAEAAAIAKSPAEEVNYAERIDSLDREIDELVNANANVTAEPAKAVYLRRRNALYSQRKYYRKKMRIQKLEADRDLLKEKNALVRAENDILERTLAWAKDQVQTRNATSFQPTSAASVPGGSESSHSERLIASLGRAANVPHSLAPAIQPQSTRFAASNALQLSNILSSPSSVNPRMLGVEGPSTNLSGVASLIGQREDLQTRLAASLQTSTETSFSRELDSSLRASSLAQSLGDLASLTNLGLPAGGGATRDALLAAQERLLLEREQEQLGRLLRLRRQQAALSELDLSSLLGGPSSAGAVAQHQADSSFARFLSAQSSARAAIPNSLQSNALHDAALVRSLLGASESSPAAAAPAPSVSRTDDLLRLLAQRQRGSQGDVEDYKRSASYPPSPRRFP